MTISTLIVPQDEVSQCKLLDQYPQRHVISNEYTLAKYATFEGDVWRLFSN